MTYVTGLECLNCGETYPNEPIFEGCPACRTDDFTSNLAPTYDYDVLADELTRSDFESQDDGVWSVPELLPVEEQYAVTIGEGNTPLVNAKDIGEEMGVPNLYLKDESQNPTWSYKDRLCSVSLAHADAVGAEVVTIASTGNHGASTAAYAARSGHDCVVFTIPDVPETMQTLMQVYGAAVVATPTHDGRWTIMRECIEQFDWYPTGNYVFPPVGSNLFGIEGYKTIAYEIVSQFDWTVPDWIVQPTAYADGLSGIWRGFDELYELGMVDKRPKMVAVEPFGPLENALDKGLDHVEAVETDNTIAFSIGAGISTYQGLKALQDSDGKAIVSDDEDLRALQNQLGAQAGMYGEASSIAAIAGARTLADRDLLDDDDIVVAIHTSTGLKDTATTASTLPSVPTIEPDLDALRTALEETYSVNL